MHDEILSVKIRAHSEKEGVSEERLKRAVKIGMKSYNWFVRCANTFMIPVYNFVFNKIHPDYVFPGYIDDNDVYNKGYKRISNFIVKPLVFLYGGYDLFRNEKIDVNVLFEMCPEKETGYYTCDDMITIKKIF